MEIVKINKTPPQETALRELPQNVEAEASLLGLLLINNGYYGQVNEVIQADHFYEPVHQRIYSAISKLIERGQVASPIVMKTQFDADPALEGIGAKYLVQLAQMAVQIQDIREIAMIIYDLALKRKLIQIGEEMVVGAFKADSDDSANTQIEQAEQQLFNLATVGEINKSFIPISNPLKEALLMTENAMKRTKSVVGITTGFLDLDNLLGGFNNSDLLILAARPSMGKTALSLNLAYNAAKEIQQEKNGCVGFFSLEMSSAQLVMRILAMGYEDEHKNKVSGIDSNKIRKGDLSQDEFAKLIKRSRELAEMPLYMDDTPALSISQVRTRARRLKRQHGLRLLIIDYLQLLRGSSKRSNESRVLEISEITQGLKAIAKEMNIPVLALSQLSRAVETRPDKRPQLSDLRESGSIEQDADVVMFIFREEYYLMREEPKEGTAEHIEWQAKCAAAQNITEILVSKQRNGPVGKVKLRFDGSTTKFEDYTGDYDNSIE